MIVCAPSKRWAAPSSPSWRSARWLRPPISRRPLIQLVPVPWPSSVEPSGTPRLSTRYVPGGKVTATPLPALAESADLIAAVSSVESSPLAPNDFTDTACWVGLGFGAALDESPPLPGGATFAADEEDELACRSAAPDPQPMSAASAAADVAARTTARAAPRRPRPLRRGRRRRADPLSEAPLTGRSLRPGRRRHAQPGAAAPAPRLPPRAASSSSTSARHGALV